MKLHFKSLLPFSVILLLILFIPRDTLLTQTQTDQPTIALVSRVVEIVERRTPEIDWKRAVIGDLLNSGDVVRTGDASFTLIRFYDNSLVRVRERSQLIVYADRDETGYHRNLQINEGSVTFDIKKQEQDRFEFSTPTSVASIRGTTGMIYTTDFEDIILATSGIIYLINLFSMQEIEILGGQLATSDQEGNIFVRDVTDEDIERFGLNGDEDTIPERRIREIDIELRDNQGNPIHLILEYEEDESNE